MEDSNVITIPAWLDIALKRTICNPKGEDLKLLYSTTRLFEHPTWKRIFEAPFFEPKSNRWLEERSNVIPASEVAGALGLDPYVTSLDEYISKKISYKSSCPNTAMQHGNEWESLNANMLCNEINDVGFGLGLLRHPTVKFLAMTPDVILLHNQTNAELKCPYSRVILTEDQISEFITLQREILWKGAACSYRLITNVSPKVVGLLDKTLTYWHQIQLQMEVLQFDTDQAFYCQLGIAPSFSYRNQSPLLVMTKVKKDTQWLQDNVVALEKVWQEIEFQKILHPKKKFKPFPFA
jgi:putative phage-type endonuclease